MTKSQAQPDAPAEVAAPVNPVDLPSEAKVEGAPAVDQADLPLESRNPPAEGIHAATRVKHTESGEVGTCKYFTDRGEAVVQWDRDDAGVPTTLSRDALERIEG